MDSLCSYLVLPLFSICSHFALTWSRFVLTLFSLCSQFVLTLLSLGLDVFSLCSHFVLTLFSLVLTLFSHCSHCVLTLLSLWGKGKRESLPPHKGKGKASRHKREKGKHAQPDLNFISTRHSRPRARTHERTKRNETISRLDSPPNLRYTKFASEASGASEPNCLENTGRGHRGPRKHQPLPLCLFYVS